MPTWTVKKWRCLLMWRTSFLTTCSCPRLWRPGNTLSQPNRTGWWRDEIYEFKEIWVHWVHFWSYILTRWFYFICFCFSDLTMKHNKAFQCWLNLMLNDLNIHFVWCYHEPVAHLLPFINIIEILLRMTVWASIKENLKKMSYDFDKDSVLYCF